jgi:hypothetical protein
VSAYPPTSAPCDHQAAGSPDTLRPVAFLTRVRQDAAGWYAHGLRGRPSFDLVTFVPASRDLNGAFSLSAAAGVRRKNSTGGRGEPFTGIQRMGDNTK